MPNNIDKALRFLETQWSSINDNKLKGINAEIRFEHYLNTPAVRPLYEYLIPGGWIISPSKITNIQVPTKGRIAILPIPTAFSWTQGLDNIAFAAQVLAASYFRQVGIATYFTKFDTHGNMAVENGFAVPESGNYQTSYPLDFFEIGSNGLVPISLINIASKFTLRTKLFGMRAYPINRLNRSLPVWQDTALVTNLFWKEYARYFFHRQYYVSSNDLDFFLVAKSGKAYPVEFKCKTIYTDPNIGDWFGIDIGPFTKLSFFVSLSNNMEALYFIEEVDSTGAHVEWWGIKFSELMKYCFWVSQSGGTAMGGGMSYTIKVPKAVFQTLVMLLPTL
jgi:hypothetical protein